MSDLSNSVIMPREDFVELQTVAWDKSQVVTPFAERAGTALTTTVFFAGAAAAVSVSVWAYAKATDWLDERSLRREIAKKQFDVDNPPSK
jgi:hypothetical protein